MAYLFLLLSSICSLAIAHLLKLNEVRGLRTLNTLTVNYAVAAVFALTAGMTGASETLASSRATYLFLFCIIVGAFFIGNFVVYGKSVHANGVGVTIASMRLSLLIPVLISVFLYAEFLNIPKMLGVALALGSLVLLIPKKKKLETGEVNTSWLLLVIFILSGFADASLKIYEEEFSVALNELTFMGLVFLGAFVIGLVFCIVRSRPLLTKKEIILGAAIGIPNLYSSIFLIYALAGISGSVAYPMVNILNVLGGTFLGLLIWNDKVSYRQWAGIAIAIIAILLLI